MVLKCAFKTIIAMLTSIASCYSHEQDFICDPNQTDHRIEFFSMKPKGDGPFPAIFLLHGHQVEPSDGGKQLVDAGYFEAFINEGILAVSISIPGFGNSDGNRDFSGPASQKAIAAVIHHFSEMPSVDSKRMGIYGCSKGATLASMVHAYYPDLSFQILEAGWYDLVSCSALMPGYLEKIKKNIIDETGGSKDALLARSALYNTHPIKSKTLILVGEFDDRRTLPSAIALHEKLISEGKDSQLKIFPKELHCISSDKWDAIIPYVREHFFDLYGVGMKPTLIMPALHIAKIHPNSPADLSKKLQIGDVVLRVSPNNNEEEIDVLRMPVSQFISLILGKKGTSVRLHVQHFDQSYEDVVLERGSFLCNKTYNP